MDAIKTLKAMSDYVASQKTLSVTFDSDVEVITSELQKLQFTSSGQMQLSRPDKLHATRTGGYTDVELVYDGKMLTINGKDKNIFAQIDAPGSVDQLIGMLRDKYSVAAPGGDLLLSRSFDEMMADVIDAKDIGRGVIDGVECEHLAFRNVRHGLADLDRAWRPSDPPQICDHQQGGDRNAAVYASHQGLEDGCRSRRVRVQGRRRVQRKLP